MSRHGARLMLVLAATTLLTAAAGAPPTDVFTHPATPAQVLAIARRATGPLADAQVVRGRFTQHRFLAELPKPLASDGDFVFARDLGIVWRTAQPFASRVVLGRNGLVQQDEDMAAVSIDAGSEPALRFVARVFFALFALDVDALATDFQLYATPVDRGWLIGLQPRAAVLRSVFLRAEIAGDDKVERVTLEDAHGDRTEILLSNVRYETTRLSVDEAAQF